MNLKDQELKEVLPENWEDELADLKELNR